MKSSSVEQLILDLLMEKQAHFTAKELYINLKSRLPAVHPSTVYRALERMTHAGKVSVTWIGSIKKEIVYHGDVLNTTSRIQDECNKHNQCFLISNYILENIKVPEYLKSEFVGELQLKGKQKKVKIYGLKGITED